RRVGPDHRGVLPAVQAWVQTRAIGEASGPRGEHPQGAACWWLGPGGRCHGRGQNTQCKREHDASRQASARHRGGEDRPYLVLAVPEHTAPGRCPRSGSAAHHAVTLKPLIHGKARTAVGRYRPANTLQPPSRYPRCSSWYCTEELGYLGHFSLIADLLMEP